MPQNGNFQMSSRGCILLSLVNTQWSFAINLSMIQVKTPLQTEIRLFLLSIGGTKHGSKFHHRGSCKVWRLLASWWHGRKKNGVALQLLHDSVISRFSPHVKYMMKWVNRDIKKKKSFCILWKKLEGWESPTPVKCQHMNIDFPRQQDNVHMPVLTCSEYLNKARRMSGWWLMQRPKCPRSANNRRYKRRG